MKLSTEVEVFPSNKKIDPASKILTLGSCFSQNIGSKLQDSKFHVSPNPFGTIFNSISIGKLIQLVAKNESLNEERISSNVEGHFFHFDFSSLVNSQSEEGVLKNIASRINLVSQSIDWLFITLGTSFGYFWKEDDSVVANCHKVNQSHFNKKLIPLSQQFSSLHSSIEALRKQSPQLNVIISVSPIRHIKDGLINNNRSKGRLLDVAHSLCEELPYAQYFPAYEILVDELRDYRYYGNDLIHPSDLAIEMIWQRFQSSLFTQDTIKMVKDIAKLNSFSKHRPNPFSKELHEQKVLNMISDMESRYPILNWK